jgi:hypothetical protein
MPFPKFDYCLICDSARPELGGKSTILGFYGITPNVDIRLQDINLPIAGLTFFLVGGAGEGQGNLQLEIRDWSGNVVLASPPSLMNLPHGERSNLVFGITGPIKFPHAGRYYVSIMKDGQTIFKDNFLVSEATPEEFARLGIQPVPKA